MATANPHLQQLLDAINRWNASHTSAQDIDPKAELAVARQEGLSGGVGDSGTSFGPNQLHAGGALPSSVYARGRDYAQNWAWSPQGLAYALAGVSHAAGGQSGAKAVTNIVKLFERPADPQGEAARALAAYGLTPPTPGAAPTAPGAPAGSPLGSLSPLLARAFDSNNEIIGVPSIDLTALASLDGAAPSPPASVLAKAAPGSGSTRASVGQIAELLREGTGGPTHSTGPHLHFAATSPQAMLAAIAEAQRLGLSARENPYTGDTVDPVHAPHSYHKRLFAGLYNGRELGQATDFSGDPAAVNALQAWIQDRYGN